MNSPIIFWFRQDLRTHDLPGLLAAAASSGEKVQVHRRLPGDLPGWTGHPGAITTVLVPALCQQEAEVAQGGSRLLVRQAAGTGSESHLCSEPGQQGAGE